MYKPVSRIGNSLGLVFDKGLCQLVGLGYGSIVKISTDGRRLIVERMPLVKARVASRRTESSGGRFTERVVESSLGEVTFVPEYHSLERLERDALAILNELLPMLSKTAMDQLYHRPGMLPARYLMRTRGTFEFKGIAGLSDVDLMTLRRMREYWEQRGANVPCADAVAAALAAYPHLPVST